MRGQVSTGNDTNHKFSLRLWLLQQRSEAQPETGDRKCSQRRALRSHSGARDSVRKGIAAERRAQTKPLSCGGDWPGCRGRHEASRSDSRAPEGLPSVFGKSFLSLFPLCFVVSVLLCNWTSYLKACFKISESLEISIFFNYCNQFLIY